jgi:hypothetical protein
MRREGSTPIAEHGAGSWREPVEKALKETDAQRLGELVVQAEVAIYERYEKLQNSPDCDEERRAIKAASDQLLTLKVNRLGWPPVK